MSHYQNDILADRKKYLFENLRSEEDTLSLEGRDSNISFRNENMSSLFDANSVSHISFPRAATRNHHLNGTNTHENVYEPQGLITFGKKPSQISWDTFSTSTLDDMKNTRNLPQDVNYTRLQTILKRRNNEKLGSYCQGSQIRYKLAKRLQENEHSTTFDEEGGQSTQAHSPLDTNQSYANLSTLQSRDEIGGGIKSLLKLRECEGGYSSKNALTRKRALFS